MKAGSSSWTGSSEWALAWSSAIPTARWSRARPGCAASRGGIPSPDIRAGIALLIAALCAEGQTVIRSIEQIDRGYEDIESKLLALGARITRRP